MLTEFPVAVGSPAGSRCRGTSSVFSPSCCRRCCWPAGLCCRSTGGRWRGGEWHVSSPPRAATAAADQLASAAGRPVDGGPGGSGMRLLSSPCCNRGERRTASDAGDGRSPSSAVGGRRRAAKDGRPGERREQARARGGAGRMHASMVYGPWRTGKDWGARAVTTKKAGIGQEPFHSLESLDLNFYRFGSAIQIGNRKDPNR